MQNFIALQVHVNVVCLYDIFTNASRGLVQIQWNLGHWMTLKSFTRLRFSPNQFGLLNAKWNLLILTKFYTSILKSQRCRSKQKPSTIGHFEYLKVPMTFYLWFWQEGV